MKKIFLMLCASMLVTSTFAAGRNLCVNVKSAAVLQDITETMPDAGSDEIVAGDEQVPL